MQFVEMLVVVRRRGRFTTEREKRGDHDDADDQTKKSGENRIHVVR